MASLLLLELHGRLLRERASSTGIHFQGLQQAARWPQKSGRGTTTISRRLRNIDVAANIVRHITQVSCDAYFNEIMSHVTQTDPVPAPDDEHVAPVSVAPSPVIKHVTPALAVPHVAPALVIEYVSPAPVMEYMAPAPAVTLSVPSQQLPPAYTTTTDTTVDNLDITDLVHPQFSFTTVEAFSPLVVGSLSSLTQSWKSSCARTCDRSGNSSGFYCGANTRTNSCFCATGRWFPSSLRRV